MRKTLFLIPVIAAMLLASHAHGAFVLGGTRVIYNEGDNDVTLSVKNTSNLPYAGQVWNSPFVETASSQQTTGSPDFVITPPVFRIEPGATQKLRFLVAREPGEDNLESVYWINVQEIPPEPKSDNSVQLAQRIRIKLFYRPAALKNQSAAEAANSLQISSNKNSIIISNPSPFSISFYAPYLETTSGKRKALDDLLTLLPGDKFIINANPDEIAKFHFQTINDYGGIDDHKAKEIAP